jgi:sugar lactone lactonase YvrE
LTSDIGGFALTEDGGAVVALREGLYRLDLESGALRLLAAPTFDPAFFRFNEGACDASGRFWIGVMFDPLEGDPPKQSGKLHSFTFGGGLREEDDSAELHNGMAWSRDGRTFYLSHSNAGEIIAFDYDADGGRLANRRIFAHVPQGDGIPDGAAIDSEGGYWTALHGGGRLRRFRADGTVDRDIDLPVSQPTMPAFAGDDLAMVYLTSASDKMTIDDLEKEPEAGALFRLDIGFRGVPRSYVVR